MWSWYRVNRREAVEGDQYQDLAEHLPRPPAMIARRLVYAMVYIVRYNTAAYIPRQVDTQQTPDKNSDPIKQTLVTSFTTKNDTTQPIPCSYTLLLFNSVVQQQSSRQ